MFSSLTATAAVLFLTARLDVGVQSFTLPLNQCPRQSSLTSLDYARGSRPMVADINSPDDLKDFIIADDKLAVIKVYADWCKTCKRFDIRYRKLASKTEFSNGVRFAQMEYGGKITHEINHAFYMMT